jgi:GTPase SAR1 family protein
MIVDQLKHCLEIPMVLVGNKSDLTQQRRVPQAQAEQRAEFVFC